MKEKLKDISLLLIYDAAILLLLEWDIIVLGFADFTGQPWLWMSAVNR